MIKALLDNNRIKISETVKQTEKATLFRIHAYKKEYLQFWIPKTAYSFVDKDIIEYKNWFKPKFN